MNKFCRGYSLFMNWFNGICAPLCGGWMMLSALVALPLSWNDWMPLSIYDKFPFHDVFFTSHFWPGLALLLVNGVANIVALVARKRRDMKGWVNWCTVAGALLVVWTVVELLIIPNGLSIFYFALGIIQLAAALQLRRAGVGSPILVSACLLGEPCRYDGKAFPCQAVMDLGKQHELVSVCPEVMGGLATPRPSCEIQPDGRVVNTEGEDRTAAFEAGARETLRVAQERGCKRAVLKENSPSCGSHLIYDGTFSGARVPGQGKTAALLAQAGIETLSEMDFQRTSD